MAPANDKAYFDYDFSRLSYHAEDTYVIKCNQGNDIALYVYTEESGKYPTILERTAVKIGIIDSKIP